jgi:hypothetical protein
MQEQFINRVTSKAISFKNVEGGGSTSPKTEKKKKKKNQDTSGEAIQSFKVRPL